MLRELSEKVAYLEGLVEGLGLDENTKENKAILGIIDVLGEVAAKVDALEEANMDLEEEMDAISEDLCDLEEDVYEGEDYDEEPDMEDYMEATCPNCGEVVCFDADIADSDDLIEVTCPNCDAVVYVNDGSMDEDIIDDEEEEEE